MAKNKTTETSADVTAFLNTVEDEGRRKDCFQLVDIMKKATGFEAKMWGPAIVGFGTYHYQYASGHSGDAPLAGFSPRKTALTLYLSPEFDSKQLLLEKFGKHKTGKGCIYIQKIADINVDILNQMIKSSVRFLQQTYPDN